MKICHYLDRRMIFPEVTAQDKEGLLSELAQGIARTTHLEADKILTVLRDRERLGSTGIGEGFAIPHGKLKDLDRILIAFGRSRRGVSFDSLDGKPAFYFFVLVAPEDSAGLHLKALAKISRFIKNGAFKERLSKASDGEAIWEAIQEQDELN